MDEKPSTNVVDGSYDEMRAVRASQPDLGEGGGRRKSVALNIVENPLKVSFAMSGPSPL